VKLALITSIVGLFVVGAGAPAATAGATGLKANPKRVNFVGLEDLAVLQVTATDPSTGALVDSVQVEFRGVAKR